MMVFASVLRSIQHQHGEASTEEGFFARLFEVFTPRQQCMNYEADVVWMHVVADSVIALAYFSIPIALVYFVRRRQDLAFNWMFLMFAAFILACGTTHAFGVWDIWQPLYRLDGLVKVVTAVISLSTAVLLWRLVPQAIALPSPAQLRLANENLAREVAERRAAQELLRAGTADLERRVEERTAELARLAEERQALLASEQFARSEAERANRSKDDFVATLSHELRTPISAILGWTHQLVRGADAETTRHGLEVIERNTRAQMRMIDDLLDMSRITAGKLSLDVQPLDAPAVIDAAIESVRHAADAKGIQIQRAFDPSAGPVKGDASRLQQIVWNLLSNAIKFTPRDGRVRVSLTRADAHVELAVSDTGQGIPPELLPHIFERFRQGDASTTRAVGGLGLGLSIVKHLVELHGGSVRVESPGKDRGTTFVVSLPLVRNPQGARRDATLAGTDVPEAPSLGGVRILAIDDDPDGRELLRFVLEERGALVTTASTAAEGLEALRAQRHDVLISDIGMPGQDGYALIRSVRQLPAAEGGKTPAIALTAFARSEDRTRALLSGYQAHVAKPMEATELVATVASLVGRGP